MRKKLIAANWKMYKTPAEARDFFRDFLPLVQGHDRDEIVVCPTYLALDAAASISARPTTPSTSNSSPPSKPDSSPSSAWEKSSKNAKRDSPTTSCAASV